MVTKIIFLIVIIFALLTLACFVFPQINYRSEPPGLCEAKLPEHLSNWVSSKVNKADRHYVKPLTFASLPVLAEHIKTKLPGVTVVEQNDKRLLAYRQSRVYHFTDWICIESDGAVTSTATMGMKDFGQNRQLVESMRNFD